jgi:hypothetical protein
VDADFSLLSCLAPQRLLSKLVFPCAGTGPVTFFFDSVQDWLKQSVKGRSPVEYAFDARCHRLLSFKVWGNNRIVSRLLYLAHQDMIENRLLPSRMLVWMALFRAVQNISNRCRIPLWDRSTLRLRCGLLRHTPHPTDNSCRHAQHVCATLNSRGGLVPVFVGVHQQQRQCGRHHRCRIRLRHAPERS